MIINSKLSKVFNILMTINIGRGAIFFSKTIFMYMDYSSGIHQSDRNGQGILLLQNDKELHTEVFLLSWKQRNLPLTISSLNIRNISKNDDYEKEYLDTNYPDISDCNLSEILSSLIYNYLAKRGKISTLIML